MFINWSWTPTGACIRQEANMYFTIRIARVIVAMLPANILQEHISKFSKWLERFHADNHGFVADDIETFVRFYVAPRIHIRSSTDIFPLTSYHIDKLGWLFDFDFLELYNAVTPLLEKYKYFINNFEGPHFYNPENILPDEVNEFFTEHVKNLHDDNQKKWFQELTNAYRNGNTKFSTPRPVRKHVVNVYGKEYFQCSPQK